MGFIMFLLVGVLAGWLAGKLLTGGGFGLWGNMGVGVAGALVGGFAFRLLGVSTGGVFGSLVTATVGAIALLVVIGLVKR